MTSKMLVRALAAVGLMGLMPLALAAPGESGWRKPWGLNLPEGVTSLSQQAYDLHMLVFYIVCAIGAFVFIGIFYSIWKFRRSVGAKPAQFHHNTTIEVVWTVIPFLILLGIAVPATQTMIKMEDTSGYDMTVKVTGYQWMWEYEYLDEDISFFSRLDRDSQRARQRNPEISPRDVEHYLLDVDNPLVVPVDKKIRFLLTANDVIHSWWVPELGWKRDAIPGMINEAWTLIEEEGVFRGQCAELCGADHGFMPIVVEAVSREAYDAWVAEQRQGMAQSAHDTARLWTREELMNHGSRVYQAQCASCHQADGSGIEPAFPALVRDGAPTGELAAHLATVLDGREGTAMAGFRDRLLPQDIAAAMTFARNAWSEDEGEVIQPASIAGLDQS